MDYFLCNKNLSVIGAIEQAAVSARTLNFYDSAVMGILAHDLSHAGIKCIEDAGGNLMTPREAIKKLEEAMAGQNHRVCGGATVSGSA